MPTVQVVGHIVDTKDIVLVYTVADKCDGVPLFIGKCMLVSIIWHIVIAGQQVVLEPWDEFLVVVSYASRL